MLRIIIMLTMAVFSVQANVIDFYKEALHNLQYKKSLDLYQKANKASQNAITYSKYVNVNVDLLYSKTYSKSLTTTLNSFDMKDITLRDTIDLFGKNNYKIQVLRLDMHAKKNTLNVKKEQVFLSLVNMIGLYNKSVLQVNLQKEFLHKQQMIFKKLDVLAKNGDITSLEILRFKNSLTTLQASIVLNEQEIQRMKKQLHVFAPAKTIPDLVQNKIMFTEKDFLAHNPSAKINMYDTKKLLATSKGLYDTYLPTVELSVDYQKLNDPTSYGDNHTFSATIHIPLNGGNFKEAEALKVAALSKKTEGTEYKIQRKNEYIGYFQAYQSAKKELDVLQKAYKDYENSEKIITRAYLKQYVDFNTYLQVLQQALGVKMAMINMQIQKKVHAEIINGIASGNIYE